MIKLRVKIKIYAYTNMFRKFNFNATPLAPLGTKAMTHNNSEKRVFWAPQTKSAGT